MSFKDLDKLLAENSAMRLAEEAKRQKKLDDPDRLRNTVYQGDRKIKQLGSAAIENGEVLNNQSNAIGDVMLPLAKGNVIRRVDNTNGGETLGSALRRAKDSDLDANGSQFSGNASSPKIPTGDGGGSGVGSGGGGGKTPTRRDPPSGCQQPPPSCVWSPDPTPPSGFQGYGSVTLESGETLNLYCLSGTSVAPDLGCDFLNPTEKWACSNGTCIVSPTGNFNSKAECEASRSIRWRGFLTTFYNGVAPGFCSTPSATNLLVAEGTISQSQSPVTAVIDNITSPTPGCPGKNHYAFIDALGNRLAFVPGSADSAYVQQNFTC